jgi:hypothetical protein
VRGDGKKLEEKGKTNNQVEKKRKKLTKKTFKDINMERQCTNQLKAEKALERQRGLKIKNKKNKDKSKNKK